MFHQVSSSGLRSRAISRATRRFGFQDRVAKVASYTLHYRLCSLPFVGKDDFEIEKQLQKQGFNRGYKVCGSPEEQVRQIREAIPPPLAKAIGTSINEHVKALLGGVEDARVQGIDMGSRKRGAEDGSQERSPKRICKD